ncbi:hypothetical protein [Enterococcus ureasiticus]|uniref:Lipoprotein n=1 Tax=Enterococcus ureasiticus TaxID=903984 RepID=A0A1E5GDQ5_9ENTE|nr:hypothetical protein [Enterococcus ureasiticus]OEG10843.1 hypothetical protein BCR21_11155 [Enterococcus ureasiticus]
MKKTILLILFLSAALVGCTSKQSEEVVTSKVKNLESENSTTTIITENVTDETTKVSTDSHEPNYTLQAIRKMAENSADLDTMIIGLYDTPDDYKILAEPTYEEGSYSFISGPANGEPVAYTENKEDTEKYNLTKNPKATSIKEVKQMIEELKQERAQNE